MLHFIKCLFNTSEYNTPLVNLNRFAYVEPSSYFLKESCSMWCYNLLMYCFILFDHTLIEDFCNIFYVAVHFHFELWETYCIDYFNKSEMLFSMPCLGKFSSSWRHYRIFSWLWWCQGWGKRILSLRPAWAT
jgi:hypothetical protein